MGSGPAGAIAWGLKDMQLAMVERACVFLLDVYALEVRHQCATGPRSRGSACPATGSFYNVYVVQDGGYEVLLEPHGLCRSGFMYRDP
jgi:hypothetical protein